MKRSLFIAIVVLLMAALFVSCNAEKSMEDQLGMVSISGPSRALDSTSENTVSVAGLYWYYTAVKADASMFTTGATGTTKKAVKDGTGLVDASLGNFSTGAWTFCFYGYEAEYDSTNANQKPVFSQTGVSVTVTKNTNTSLELTLVKGEGYSKTAKFAIDGATWYYQFAGTGKALTLSVYDGNATTPLTTLTAETVDGAASFSTATATEFTLAEGEHTLRFEVTYDANANQLVGSTTYPIVVAGGYNYTISNLSASSAGIETIDENGAIVIAGQYDVETGAATASGRISAAASTGNEIVADIAPVSEASATVNPTTTVSFPAGALTEGSQYTLDIETTPFGTVPSTISIAEGEEFVAGFNLTLNNGEVKTFNGKAVTVVTYIAKGLDKTKLTVCYNGTGDQPELVDYDPATGELEFTTTHFSEFYVKSTETIVAKIGNNFYGSLVTAVAALEDGDTLVLLKDLDFSTEEYAGYFWDSPLEIAKDDIVFDLNGHTISKMGNAAIRFGHILAKDGRIANATIKNGTLSVGQTDGVTRSYALCIAGTDGAKIENITTLGGINVFTGSKNVEIINCNVTGTKYYTVCVQSGSDVTIKGTTYTKNTDSTVANKSMFWVQGASSDSDMVTTENPSGDFGASSITLESGTFTVDTANGGAFYLTSGLKPIVKGGSFNIDPTAYLANGFSATEDNGTWTVSAN